MRFNGYLTITKTGTYEYVIYDTKVTNGGPNVVERMPFGSDYTIEYASALLVGSVNWWNTTDWIDRDSTILMNSQRMPVEYHGVSQVVRERVAE
jgi:hypothetical protein